MSLVFLPRITASVECMRVGYVLLLLASAALSAATLRAWIWQSHGIIIAALRSASQHRGRKIGHRDSNLFLASADDASVSAKRKCSACLFVFTTADTLPLSELDRFHGSWMLKSTTTILYSCFLSRVKHVPLDSAKCLFFLLACIK